MVQRKRRSMLYDCKLYSNYSTIEYKTMTNERSVSRNNTSTIYIHW